MLSRGCGCVAWRALALGGGEEGGDGGGFLSAQGGDGGGRVVQHVVEQDAVVLEGCGCGAGALVGEDGQACGEKLPGVGGEVGAGDDGGPVGGEVAEGVGDEVLGGGGVDVEGCVGLVAGLEQ